MFYKDYKKLIVNIDQDYRLIIEKMTINRIGFVIVIDKNNKFLGIINDGDIRRALFNTKNKITSIKKT